MPRQWACGMEIIVKQSIVNCELAFKKCFSNWAETEQLIRFRDRKLSDMYAHNTAFIKTSGMEVSIIRDCILDELEQSKKDGLTFSHNICDRFLEKSDLTGLWLGEPDITHFGFYVLDFSRIQGWKENIDCETKIADSQQNIRDILILELANYGDERGESFCTRRINRLGEIFLSSVPVNACLAYYENELAGKCELFLYNDTAKIEDFDVKTNLQKRYIGTTLLKAAVIEAKKRGAEEIYLVTDEDDTVKEMYKNLGYEKVGVWTEVFWSEI